MVVSNTPVEHHVTPDGTPVLVKREDLCCPTGPPFSKMRGVYTHIAARPEHIIGVLDTYHSKAGWAVAAACQAMGKHAVNYWPRYKRDALTVMRGPQMAAQKCGAELVALPAGRSAILYHQAKKHLIREWPMGYMMPNALKLRESVGENHLEAQLTHMEIGEVGTIVISISSGTVAAGVLSGWMSRTKAYPNLILHMGYSRSINAVRRYIEGSAGYQFAGLLFIDEGYAYGDRVDTPCPFPSNPYYDRKAWKWLCSDDRPKRLPQPILFWNIGD